MKIAYSVCGEGLGHAARSRVAIEHLLARGHEVRVFAAGRAAPYLAKSFGTRVTPIEGLTMATRDGALDLYATLEDNVTRIPRVMSANVPALVTALEWGPEAAISDFDGFAWAVGRLLAVPVVSIDNQHVLTRCRFEESMLGRYAGKMRTYETVVEACPPNADAFIVTSFMPVEPLEGVTVVTPILRKEILDLARNPAPPSNAVLCYKSLSSVASEDERFLEALAAVSARFVVYGLPDDAKLPPNVVRRTDPLGLARDLSASCAVIGNGTFTLLGEALALGKPVHAVPIRGQYEQVLNAIHLEACGYGTAAHVFDASAIKRFLGDLPRFREAIAARPQHDENVRLRAKLDRLFPAVKSPIGAGWGRIAA